MILGIFPPSDFTVPVFINLNNDVFHVLAGLNRQKAYEEDGSSSNHS